MGPDLIKTWEERLDFGHEVWKAKGLKGGKDAPDDAQAGMEAYRNQTEPRGGWGRLDADAIIRVPITFSSINTMEAQLIARDPQFSIFPRSENAVEMAPIVEVVINHYVYEQRMKRQWQRALKDALLVGGFGIVWHGYTPLLRKIKVNDAGEPQRLIEYYDPAKPDAPWIRRIPPWDVRIDPTQSSFHPDEDAAWCARRILLSPEQYADDPMFSDKIKVEPTQMLNIRAMRPHIEKAGREGPDFPKRIEIWEVYDKVNEIMFHLSEGAEGKILTKGGERAWPEGVPREGLPYSYLMFNEQPNDPFPISYESMIRQLQVELNKCRTMMGELVKRLRRLVLYRKGAMGEGEAERLIEEIGLKEMVEVTGGDLSQVIAEVALGQFPQEVLVYEQRIVDTIREVLGQSRFQRAQRENVESAEEAARIGLGDDTQVGRNQAAMEDFVTDSVRKWFQGFRKVGTDEVLIPIVGQDDAAMFERDIIAVTPKQIEGEYLFRIKLGSTRPNNEMQEKMEARQMLEMVNALQIGEVVSLPQLLIDLFRAHNKSPKRYLLNEEMRKRTAAATPKQQGPQKGQGSQPKPVDINAIRPVGGGRA